MRSGDEKLKARAATLAAAARALNSAGGGRAARAPFSLAFLTDPRGPDPLLMAAALPAGAALILRDYADPQRASRAAALAACCAARGVLFLVAGDARLARAVSAAGVHLRADQLDGAPAPRFDGLISASTHDAAQLAKAGRLGAHAAFLSPVFPTASHPGAAALGPDAFRRLAQAAATPVLALGGVDETSAAALAGENVAGFGAIGAFAGAPGAGER